MPLEQPSLTVQLSHKIITLNHFVLCDTLSPPTSLSIAG